MPPLLERLPGRRLIPARLRVPGPPGPPDLPGRAFPYGYMFISLLALGIGYLNVIAPGLGWLILREDHLLENLTVVFYGAAALALLAAAVRPQPWFPPRALYLLAAAGCLFFAGEELSWGQRLFGFATPEFFAGFNAQSEINFHNYDNGGPAFIQFLAARSRLLSLWLALCLAAAAAWFHGKDELFGVPLPSRPLLFGFMLPLAYFHPAGVGVIIGSGAHTLLLLFFLYAGLARQGRLLWLALAALVNLEAVVYINNNLITLSPRNLGEPFELLAAAGFLAYSLELLRGACTVRRGAGGPGGEPAGGAPASGSAPAGGLAAGRSSMMAWLLAGAFVIVASLALVGLESIKARRETAQAAAAWQWVAGGAAGEPFARSEAGLEVYWSDGRLIYVGRGQSCAELERRPRIFLHLTPVSPEDLPETRRGPGYAVWDFTFAGVRKYQGDDGSCAAAVPLPDYPLAQIHTGESGAGVAPWENRLLLDFTAYQSAYESAIAAPPALRSTFDVYLDGRAVTYIKEPCDPADTAGMFVLHAFPAHPDDLTERPGVAEATEFNNLDFPFYRHGARFEGKCVASAPLPDYPIDRLRVGQWLPSEERNLWRHEFPAGR